MGYGNIQKVRRAKMKFEIKGRKISGQELLGMLEDSDSETKWVVEQ